MTEERDERKERLNRIRDRERERSQREKTEDEDKEIERGELEEKLEEKHGRSGRDFVILQTTGGTIAVARKEGLLYTAWAKKLEAGEPHQADTEDWVSKHLIHPDEDSYRQIVDKLPGVAKDAAFELMRLYRGVEVARIPK